MYKRLFWLWRILRYPYASPFFSIGFCQKNCNHTHKNWKIFKTVKAGSKKWYFFSFLLGNEFYLFIACACMVIFQLLKSFNFRLNKSDSNSKKTKDLQVQPGNISKAEGRRMECRLQMWFRIALFNYEFFFQRIRWIPSMIIKWTLEIFFHDTW